MRAYFFLHLIMFEDLNKNPAEEISAGFYLVKMYVLSASKN